MRLPIAITLLVALNVSSRLIVANACIASVMQIVQMLLNVLSNVIGVPGIENLEVHSMVLSSKQVYTFVHRAFYERGESCSRMIKQAQGLFREAFTPEFLTYAVQLYSKFEKSAAESTLSDFAKGHFCSRQNTEGGADLEEQAAE